MKILTITYVVSHSVLYSKSLFAKDLSDWHYNQSLTTLPCVPRSRARRTNLTTVPSYMVAVANDDANHMRI